ncbi:hypothetical protein V0U79_05175 [Hyphobacterium sp. HN65]|uniref:Uncharacterized protein n=1 Tax=Hyphobacterium lacteum TaxID=3116575 RepID=A0ABU7LPC0_9PROT|nr:hypothetical protein [Hyphobacterium sp. HN65]MEE2525750.1 hypothetical protein [Hyphobacterium sp. HN65]
MFAAFRKSPSDTVERPQLELSGPALTEALERIAAGCEAGGGIDRYVMALQLRHGVFSDILIEKNEGPLSPESLAALTMFMPTVRRRIAPYLSAEKFGALRDAITGLLETKHEYDKVDERMAAFCSHFPQDKTHRWVRDLAAELLHGVDPERYPMMCRWIWDETANTGVLREIWHGDIDSITLHVPDTYGTFLMLREELSQFLASHGVMQDTQAHVDLLCAQIYAEYISAQGGSYLRADFSSADDPMAHVRRLLGLDGIQPKANRIAGAGTKFDIAGAIAQIEKG